MKEKYRELQEEQKRAEADPETLERQAREAEEAMGQLSQQRDGLRFELQQREALHGQAREEWQASVKQLQGVRQGKEFAERECHTLKQQLEARWSSWQPRWSQRLQQWRGHCALLGRAQRGKSQLADAMQRGWEGLHG